jgi:hypothetical protein
MFRHPRNSVHWESYSKPRNHQFKKKRRERKKSENWDSNHFQKLCRVTHGSMQQPWLPHILSCLWVFFIMSADGKNRNQKRHTCTRTNEHYLGTFRVVIFLSPFPKYVVSHYSSSHIIFSSLSSSVSNLSLSLCSYQKG